MNAMRRISGWTLRWILNFAALLVVAWILDGFELGLWGAVVGGGFISLVNAFIRPVLTAFHLPVAWKNLSIGTLGVNLAAFLLTAVTIKGVDVRHVGALFLAALLVSLFSFIISSVVDRHTYNV
jgi:putative membrane protein